MAVMVEKNKCIGCAVCLDSCPSEAFIMEDGIAVVDPKKCTECGECIMECASEALSLADQAGGLTPKKTTAETKEEKKEIKKVEIANIEDDYLSAFTDVWVFIEQIRGKAMPVSWELLGAGRHLAEKRGSKLIAILLGYNVDHIAEECFVYGADRVILVDDALLADYRTEPFALELTTLAEKHKPEILLMGATTMGRDISGAVATRLKTGLTADCTELDIDDKANLTQTRPAFGGNIMATILTRKHRPQMATVRPRVMEMPSKKIGNTGEILKEELDLQGKNPLTEVLEYIEEENAVYLDRSEIIVAGGRGLGDAKGFQLLKELSHVLGGILGASRAAVEAGWIGSEYQVGQTGITVRPKIYFAIGISGAIQHLVGMQTSDVIVAVNTDPDAPIFKVSTFGIVGDLYEVVPELIENFKLKLGV